MTDSEAAVYFELKMRFSFGWCILELSNGSERVELQNHWVSNRLRDFTAMACAVFDGVESASCRWPRELAGGYFIDLVRSPHGGLSLVVHELHFGNEAHTLEQIYSARRGVFVFAAELTVDHFAATLAAELRRIRYVAVDSVGVIHEWRAAFPEPEFQAIERYAAAHGYEPKTEVELRAELEAVDRG